MPIHPCQVIFSVSWKKLGSDEEIVNELSSAWEADVKKLIAKGLLGREARWLHRVLEEYLQNHHLSQSNACGELSHHLPYMLPVQAIQSSKRGPQGIDLNDTKSTPRLHFHMILLSPLVVLHVCSGRVELQVALNDLVNSTQEVLLTGDLSPGADSKHTGFRAHTAQFSSGSVRAQS